MTEHQWLTDLVPAIRLGGAHENASSTGQPYQTQTLNTWLPALDVSSIAAPATAGLVSMVCVILLIPVLRKLATDHPNNRSSHLTPTPRGGGVAVIAGMLAGVSVAAFLGAISVRSIVIGTVAMTVLGSVDDVRSLSARVRLLVTLVISFTVSTFIVDPSSGSTWSLAIGGCVFLAGYANSFNFMDGINGISALNSALAATWLGFIIHHEQLNGGVPIALALAGASLAFLPFNAPRAKVFLGDSGSYGIGFAIAGLAVWAWHSGSPLLLVLAPLTIYLLDTFTAFARRLVRREHTFAAHREHVYQRLTDSGLSHVGSASIVLVFGLAACVSAWFARDSSYVITLACWAALGALYLALPRIFGASRKRTGHITTGGESDDAR